MSPRGQTETGGSVPKLAIYLHGLQGGGVERISLNLIPEFQTRGFEVSLVLDRAEGELLGQLPSVVRLVELGASRTLRAIPRLAHYLRRERPDVLLSSLGHNNIAALMARRLARTPTKVIVCQHNFLSMEAKAPDLRYRLLPLLYRLSLPRAEGVVAVSQGVADDMALAAGFDRRRIDVIYNPVVTSSFLQMAAERADHPWFEDTTRPIFLAVGRLVEQKDYPTLLRAFARIRKQRPCRLVILGTGPLGGRLEALVRELGIGDDTALLGFKPNPHPYIRAASVLVLASRYEGFGNVLVEALACGTPVVSTDCPAGPREILKNGRYGGLVPVGDVEGLARAMQAALTAPPARPILLEGAARFHASVVGSSYASLIRRVLNGKAG